MPGLLIPSKSGVHQAACFALYRALLRQTRRLPPRGPQRYDYVERIGLLCRKNAKLQGHRDITTALQLGYRTLEALQRKDQRSIVLRKITELDGPPVKARSSEKPGAPKQEAIPGKRTPRQERRAHQYTSSLLERPFLKISGRRHVPVLVNACRVPILRYKKPQPASLSGMIRQTIDAREKRLAKAGELAKLLPLGEDEDEWDRIISRQFHVARDKDLQEPYWTDEIRYALEENRAAHDTHIRKRRKLAEHMTDIVRKEKAMAAKERRERKRRDNSSGIDS